MSRTCFAAVEFNNQLWFVGGLMHIDDSNTEDIGPFGMTKLRINTIQVYDSVNKIQFLLKLKMVKAMSNIKVIVYEDKLFVFSRRGYNDKPLNSVEMYFTDVCFDGSNENCLL